MICVMCYVMAFGIPYISNRLREQKSELRELFAFHPKRTQTQNINDTCGANLSHRYDK